MDKELRMRCVEAALTVASAQSLRSPQNVVEIATVFAQYVGCSVEPVADKPLSEPRKPGRPRKIVSEADNLLS